MDQQQHILSGVFQRKVPPNYRPYFLEDLVQEVTSREGKNDFSLDGLTVEEKKVRYSKMLFYIGEFTYGLEVLLDAGYQIQATILTCALVELSLLATKQSMIRALQTSSHDSNVRNSLRPFTPGDLSDLYGRAIDLDGNLLLLAWESCDQLNYISESLTLLFMV
jgi:hypothetical protein